MIQIVWEFVVWEEFRGKFELAYGPGGVWSKLFAECPGFRGTTLLRDSKNARRFLTIDFWDTMEQREHMLTEREAEYATLDATFTEWTESKAEVGVFRSLAEATVRPHRKGGRSKTREVRRRGRPTTR